MTRPAAAMRASNARSDVGEFMAMLGIRHFGELPRVRRAHVIAWRKMLEARGLGPATKALGRLLALPLPLQRESRPRESRLGRQAAQDGERE